MTLKIIHFQVFRIESFGIISNSWRWLFPFPNIVNNSSSDKNPKVSYYNESVQEKIPVTLRDVNGNIVFPKTSNFVLRKTGVRVQNNGKLPQAEDTVRVNTTKYHNMYATAERLIANKIIKINIPQIFTDESGFPEGLSIRKPFEIPNPLSERTTEDGDIRRYPSFMSTIIVEPDLPAIYTGGGADGFGVGTVVAGASYISDDAIGFNEDVSVGGKSMQLNSEGSIELSVGADIVDKKSLILDTAGSLVAWFGKDKNNRSMVMQTDGDVLFNIGGSYNNDVMNKGRFDLRVNVTDKQFIDTKFSPGKYSEEGGNPGSDSDFIISISENGIVIAGMKKDAPMVIRNDGEILIESTGGALTLKGTSIRTVDPKGVINQIKQPTRSSWCLYLKK